MDKKLNYYKLIVIGSISFLALIVTLSNLGFKGSFIGYDAGVTSHFPGKTLKYVYSLWDEFHAPGKPSFLGVQSFVWFNFLALLERIILSPIVLQRIVYFLAIFISGFSAYYLVRTILRLTFPKANTSPYLYFGSLASSVIYMFNYYTMLLFSQPNLNFQFFYLFTPLALAKIIEIIELEDSNFRDVFILSLLLMLIFSANIGSIVVFLSIAFLYLNFYIFSKGFKIRHFLRPVYLKIIILMLLLTAYIWLPSLISKENPWRYAYLFGDNTEGSLTEVFKEDFLSSANFNSKISSFLNLFRLSGLMIWPSFSYYEYFHNYSWLIILSFFLPLVLLVGLVTASYKKAEKRHILIYFLFLLPIFLFLSKGLHKPLSSVYLKIYQLIPYFEMFRASYLKFIPVVIMAYLLFFGIFTYLFFVFISEKFKRAKTWNFLIFFLFLAAILMHNWPFFLGRVVRKGDLCIIPQDYYEVNEYLKKEGGIDRVLTLPPLGGKSASWGESGENGDYGGSDRDPIIFDRPILSSLWFIENGLIVQVDVFSGFDLENSLAKVLKTVDLFDIRYILLHKDSLRTRDFGVGGGFKNYQREKRKDIIEGILAKENFIKLALETDNLALYRIDDSVFSKRIYVPEKTYFVEGGISDLFYAYPFEKATKGRIIIFSNFKDRNNTFSLNKVDEIFVRGELKDAIGEGELAVVPEEISLPFIRWRPDHFIYPLVLKKEGYDKWGVRNEPIKLFEKHLFYASKRISEMVEYAPMIAETKYSVDTRERYEKEMVEALEILESLRLWHDEDFLKLWTKFKGTIWGHQEKIGEIGELENWEILFGELEEKVDELEVERDFSRLVYKLEVPKEGKYEIFMKDNDEWISLGGRDFEKGAQMLVLPVEGISENLVDENLKVEDYTPDSVYKISFDYQAPHGGSFFIAEGKAGETAETNLLPTGEEFRHFEMFFKSSLEAENASVHLSISIAGERNLRVERIYQPKLILRISTESSEVEQRIPKITFIKVNPTKYKVKVEGAKEPYNLIFSETFHQGWKAYVNNTSILQYSNTPDIYGEIVASYFDGEIKEGTHKNIFLNRDTFETWDKKPIPEERHLLVNGYANSWYITPEDVGGEENYEIIIEFWPQKLFYIGLFISGLTLIGCFGYLIFEVFSRKF